MRFMSARHYAWYNGWWLTDLTLALAYPKIFVLAKIWGKQNPRWIPRKNVAEFYLNQEHLKLSEWHEVWISETGTEQLLK